jgi:hypothetical protein
MQTSRVDGVKAAQHRGTPRARDLVDVVELVPVVLVGVVVACVE